MISGTDRGLDYKNTVVSFKLQTLGIRTMMIKQVSLATQYCPQQYYYLSTEVIAELLPFLVLYIH